MPLKLTDWQLNGQGFIADATCACPTCLCENEISIAFDSEQKHAVVRKCGYANLDDNTISPAHTGDNKVYEEYSVTRVYNDGMGGTDTEIERFYISSPGPGIIVVEENFIPTGTSCASGTSSWTAGPVDQLTYPNLQSETKAYLNEITDTSAATSAQTNALAQSWVSGGQTSEWGYQDRVVAEAGAAYWEAVYFAARNRLSITIPIEYDLPPTSAIFQITVDYYRGDDPGPYDLVDTKVLELVWDSGRTWLGSWVENPTLLNVESSSFKEVAEGVIMCLDQYQTGVDLTTE